MAGSREDARVAGSLRLETGSRGREGLMLHVLGNIDHFRGSTLAQMLDCIGCRVCNFLPPASSLRSPACIAWLPRDEARPDIPCINRDTDSDKRRLADHFYRVFRYPLGVDPSHYDGEIVQKSLRNGAHDGRVLRGPIDTTDNDAVYQHLIDNRTSGERIIDLRVPFIGGIAPVCWLKCRPIETRFASQSSWARLATPDELFSADERTLISRFCEEVHLEYGELDVLRDVQSDSIYIVDVNPTPHPLTKGIEPREWSRAVQQMATRFHEVFLS
jgi:hypothetical protein